MPISTADPPKTIRAYKRRFHAKRNDRTSVPVT